MSHKPGAWAGPSHLSSKGLVPAGPKQREGVVEEGRVGSLTIIQPKNDPGTQEGSQSLSHGVDGQLDPGLTRQEAQSKGHGRVQVGPWAEGRWNLLAPACHSGEARIPPPHTPPLWPGEQGCREGFLVQNGVLDYVTDRLD